MAVTADDVQQTLGKLTDATAEGAAAVKELTANMPPEVASWADAVATGGGAAAAAAATGAGTGAALGAATGPFAFIGVPVCAAIGAAVAAVGAFFVTLFKVHSKAEADRIKKLSDEWQSEQTRLYATINRQTAFLPEPYKSRVPQLYYDTIQAAIASGPPIPALIADRVIRAMEAFPQTLQAQGAKWIADEYAKAQAVQAQGTASGPFFTPKRVLLGLAIAAGGGALYKYGRKART